MTESLVRPCAKCPFRNDIEPYLTYGRAVEIASALYHGAKFSCHETVEHDDDGEHAPNSREQFCAGAMLTLLKYDGPNNYMRVMSRIGAIDLDKLEKEAQNAPLYEDLEDWIHAHDY
jgi:hypothetical protein